MWPLVEEETENKVGEVVFAGTLTDPDPSCVPPADKETVYVRARAAVFVAQKTTVEVPGVIDHPASKVSE
jgi:hypothetical protein